MILLDAHIWVRWLLEDNALPRWIIDKIETSDSVAVSAISVWEVILLQQRNRLELPTPIDLWLEAALTGSEVQALPITFEIAYLSATLTKHHKDPADRIIIATSIFNRIPLLSLDATFPCYGDLANLLLIERDAQL